MSYYQENNGNHEYVLSKDAVIASSTQMAA